MKPSDNAHEIALNAWKQFKTGKHIVDLVAESGEHVTIGQVSAMIERARRAGDSRAIKHNLYATIVRAA